MASWHTSTTSLHFKYTQKPEVDELLDEDDNTTGNIAELDEEDLVDNNENKAISVAIAKCRTSMHYYDVVHIGQSSCPHSNYLTSTGMYHSIGYLGEQTYVLRLHILPVVPGHRHFRIATRSTQTTIEQLKVSVVCNINWTSTISYVGSKALSKVLVISTVTIVSNQKSYIKAYNYHLNETSPMDLIMRMT